MKSSSSLDPVESMSDILLDTNIVIYLLDDEPRILRFMQTFVGKTAGVSVITYMEAMIGAGDEDGERKVREFFAQLDIIPIDTVIGDKSVLWMRRERHNSLRKAPLADAIIGHTALEMGVPLITNNPKDFASIKGLRLITP